MLNITRYQRGSRSLADNLKQSKDSTSQRITMSNAAPVTSVETEEEDEEYDIPDEIEEVIGNTLDYIEQLKIYSTILSSMKLHVV